MPVFFSGWLISFTWKGEQDSQPSDLLHFKTTIAESRSPRHVARAGVKFEIFENRAGPSINCAFSSASSACLTFQLRFEPR